MPHPIANDPLVERMDPTYARHAGRRAEELGEVETMIETLGLEASFVRSARMLTETLSRLDVAPEASTIELVRRVEAGSPRILDQLKAAAGA